VGAEPDECRFLKASKTPDQLDTGRREHRVAKLGKRRAEASQRRYSDVDRSALRHATEGRSRVEEAERRHGAFGGRVSGVFQKRPSSHKRMPGCAIDSPQKTILRIQLLSMAGCGLFSNR
jgi:hypothetical protein